MEIIAGVDEVGRGPLAGPVLAAAVILPDDHTIEGLRDSKKLSKLQREKLFPIIQEQALGIGIGLVDVKTIDEIKTYMDINNQEMGKNIYMSQLIEKVNNALFGFGRIGRNIFR